MFAAEADPHLSSVHGVVTQLNELLSQRSHHTRASLDGVMLLHFAFCFQPVVEIMTRLFATLLISLVGATSNVFGCGVCWRRAESAV
jgi:uncharacterized membrane protein